MWARVDDGWWKHRKVMALSMSARGLWVTALSYAGDQRDDHVPASLLHLLCRDSQPAEAVELVDAGLWDKDPDGDGYRIHDWREYQQGSSTDAKSNAGRIGGLTRALREAEARAEVAESALRNVPGTDSNPSTFKQPASSEQADVSEPLKHGPEPEPEPVVPSELETHDRPAADPDDGFDTWWESYRHVARGRPTGAGPRKKANAAWRRLTVADRGKATAAVDVYGQLLTLRDATRPQPFPAQHGSTWLNSRMFDDVADELADARSPTVRITRAAQPRGPTCDGCAQPLDDHDPDVHDLATGTS